jgi:hypothetical protein
MIDKYKMTTPKKWKFPTESLKEVTPSGEFKYVLTDIASKGAVLIVVELNGKVTGDLFYVAGLSDDERKQLLREGMDEPANDLWEKEMGKISGAKIREIPQEKE